MPSPPTLALTRQTSGSTYTSSFFTTAVDMPAYRPTSIMLPIQRDRSELFSSALPGPTPLFLARQYSSILCQLILY